MKKEEIMKNVSATFSKVSVKLKKHSPEILVVAGVVGTVASAVMACHATTKLDSVLEKSKKILMLSINVLKMRNWQLSILRTTQRKIWLSFMHRLV